MEIELFGYEFENIESVIIVWLVGTGALWWFIRNWIKLNPELKGNLYFVGIAGTFIGLIISYVIVKKMADGG